MFKNALSSFELPVSLQFPILKFCIAMGVHHSKQSCDISSTPKKKAEANGKAPVEDAKVDEKATVTRFDSYAWIEAPACCFAI